MGYYKEKSSRTDLYMKPRIFVSSTFYDLKYAREDLSNFIKAHDFDPIMFENGDIGYTSGKALDDACYEAMKGSDMAILIIGGNYGSTATGENPQIKDYTSITRKEFRTAILDNIPIYVFVESKVNAEYDVYEMNEASIEDGSKNIQFKATKDLNVFRFIKEVKKVGNVPITEFSKPSEIKDFLGKQWSDMFKNYLNLLREGEQRKSLNESMIEMKNLISKMELMVNGIGKQVLKNTDDYYSILEMQDVVNYSGEISSMFGIDKISDFDGNEREKFIENLLSSFENVYEDKVSGIENKEYLCKLYDYFYFRNIDIKFIKYNFIENLDNIVEFIKTPKNRNALIKSLSSDKYFKMMVA